MMSLNKKRYFFYFVLLGYIICCDEIIVPDISDDVVILTSPEDSTQTQSANQIFAWEPLSETVSYQITLESKDGLVLDSVLRESSLAISVDSGSYTWCVKAFNTEYKTERSCRHLVVQGEVPVKTDISNLEVDLLAPADTLKTKTKQQLFWWDKIDGATKYQLVIVSPDIISPTQIVLDTLVVENSFSQQLEVGKYQWCVRGINSAFETSFTCRKMEIIN